MGDTKAQDLDASLVDVTSRLKSNFRSECSRQPFPCFDQHTILPELQELILARLPALKLAELKVVSRSWRALLQSPKFKERRQSIRGGCGSEVLDVWVMKSTNEQEDTLAFIPLLREYGPFLRLVCNPLVTSKPSIIRKLREKRPLCGSGPLLLLADKEWQVGAEFPFSMHNLENGQSERIPGLRMFTYNENGECFTRRILGAPVLIASEDNSHFCLVLEVQRVYAQSCYSFPLSDALVNENGVEGPHELFFYESLTPSWTPFPPKESAVEADHMGRLLGGKVFLHYDQDDSTLYAWSNEHYNKVCVTFPSRGTTSASTMARGFKVFKCEGHVLLITSVVELVESIALQGFIIWKLARGEGSWSWVEISRTPRELCLKSYDEGSFLFPTFMSDGRHICAISSSQEFFPPMVYDVKHDSWCHLHGVLKNMEALFTTKMIFHSDKL